MVIIVCLFLCVCMSLLLLLVVVHLCAMMVAVETTAVAVHSAAKGGQDDERCSVDVYAMMPSSLLSLAYTMHMQYRTDSAFVCLSVCAGRRAVGGCAMGRNDW